MARLFLLYLAAACCCLALLPSTVQGRPGAAGRDHRPLFLEPHFDAAEPKEQQGGTAVKKKATPSPPSPMAGGIVTPELRWVPGGANPLHNYGGTTRQDEEHTPPAVEGNVVRPELRTAPWGANPLHNR